MTDDQLELVNAYLDGEATPDERALVESDAELLAEVARLRTVRNALSDVAPPSASARESAIAAALAVFDELPAAAAAPAAPAPRSDATAPTNIVPFERRRRMRRIQGLSAAAVAVLIVAGGIAISQRDDGDSTAERDLDSAASAPASAPLAAGTTNDAVAGPSTTPTPMMVVVPSTVGFEAGDETADAAAADAPEGTLPSATQVSEMAVSSTTSPAVGAAPPAPAAEGTVATLEVLRDDDDLADFAATMKDPPLDSDDAATQCEDDTLKADAVYEDDDGDRHPIVVVMIDEENEQLGAMTLDSCEIVLPVD